MIFTERQYNRGELPAPLPYDPDGAKQLLEEAGWRDTDGDGIRDRGGRPFRFALLTMEAGWTAGTSRKQATVYIQAQLRRVGVQMEILAVDLAAGRERWKAGEFEAAIITGQSGERGNLSRFGKERIGYNNPTVIDLLEKAEASMNPDDIDRIYRELMLIFQVDLPITALYPAVWTTVAHQRLRGLSSPHRADPLWHIEHLWLEDDD